MRAASRRRGDPPSPPGVEPERLQPVVRDTRRTLGSCASGTDEGSYASNGALEVQTLAQGRQGVARKEKGLDCTHRGGPRESREGTRTWGARGERQRSKPHRVSALALAQDTSTRLHQDSRTGCMGARVIFCPIITSLRVEHGHLLCMISTRLHPDSRTNERSICVSTLTRKRTIRCWRTRVIFWPDIKPRLFEHSHLIIQTGTPTCEYETATKTRCVSETSREEELRSSSRRPGPGSVGGQA